MLIKASKIKKTYGAGHTALTVLDNLDFEYTEGEVVGVYGASGSGKSTFLHIIGGLERPSGGGVMVDGEELYSYPERKIANYRNKTIGFVFQFYHLLPEFSARENVMIPCLIAGVSKRVASERAREALAKTGLTDREKHRPAELSGGEQQRVAISRAIVMGPKVLLADEPTGNLDKATGQDVLRFLFDLNKRDGMGIVMVTHDVSLVHNMNRVLELKDGRLQ